MIVMKYVFIFIIGVTMHVYSQAGTFETSFGINGISNFCFTQGSHQIMDAGFQSDGKTLYMGVYAEPSCVDIVRANTDGSIDSTFGNQGIIANICASFPNGGYYVADMAIQSDDKILLMGTQQNSTYPNAYWVSRLTANGDIDPTFNGTGYTDVSFGTPQDRGYSIGLQPDGKILVGGSSGNAAQLFTVARLNSSGSIDSTFGDNGKVQVPFFGTESAVCSILVQPDGKILLGGFTVHNPFGQDYALVRLLSTGAIDTSFGTNGKVVTTIDSMFDGITQLVLQPDGKIIAAGYNSLEYLSKMVVVRYLSNGDMDASFGNNGIKLFPDGYGQRCSVALDQNNRIVATGGAFHTYRLLNNGDFDNSFGSGGAFDVPLELQDGLTKKVLIQNDGKIVVVGNAVENIEPFNICATYIRLYADTLNARAFDTERLVLFPNPTQDVVYIDNSVMQFEKVHVYDVVGNEISTQDLPIDSNAEIQLRDLASGVYLLKLVGKGKLITTKVLKY